MVRPVREPGLVVVDILDLDDELGLGLQRPVCQPVSGLSSEDVLGLDLAVQPLDGVDVARAVVDGEGGTGAFARQDVLDGAVAFIHVRVELWVHTIKNSNKEPIDIMTYVHVTSNIIITSPVFIDVNVIHFPFREK